MGHHHTKDKGDLGIAKAHADLVSQGCTVLFPATEHAPFDLVAYRDQTFSRVQVKFRSVTSGGSVSVQLRSVWSDRHGVHMKPAELAEIDVMCIYCPQTDACYYVRPSPHQRSITLRVLPARNGQRQGITSAEDHRRLT